jgi:type II secretory pathway pseudopilin PulG
MVVIVIIIILMGLLTPVLINVMARAREARITAEISAMDGALKAYKERYGSIPPSDFTGFTATYTSPPAGSNAALVQMHLARAFPRCNVATELTAINNLIKQQSNATLTPAQALVFWLSGYSSDPEHPLSGHYQASGTTVNGYIAPATPLALTPFFSFDATRLVYPSGVTATTAPSYIPTYMPADALGSPYLYFAAQNYSTQAVFSASAAGQGGTGSCKPYLLDNGSLSSPTNLQSYFANPSTFQIISAGLDGDFGDNAITSTPNASYPSGKSGSISPPGSTTTAYPAYSQGDLDNLTNFSKGNLKDDMP